MMAKLVTLVFGGLPVRNLTNALTTLGYFVVLLSHLKEIPGQATNLLLFKTVPGHRLLPSLPSNATYLPRASLNKLQCLKANAEVVPKYPRCHYMLLM